METQSDVVADPVGHISISGVHGRKELDQRLANARPYDAGGGVGLGKLVAGALIGAAIMYLFHPDRRARRNSNSPF